MIMTNNKFTLIVCLLFFVQTYTQAQIAIGKTSVDGSALLDFPENTLNGIILPHVENADSMKVNTPGTIVFDKASAKFKYFDGTQWVTMNREEGLAPVEVPTLESETDQGVIIGSGSSTAMGVLILESDDKALVLPKVTRPAQNIPSPYPGMIVYDLYSDNVYFFNGTVWEFWGH